MIGGLGVGQGANLVGGLMQSAAATMAKHEMEQAFAREQELQNRYRNESFGVTQTGLPGQGVEQARTDIAKGAGEREGLYAGVNQSPLAFGAQPTGRDNALYTMLGKNRARLGGYTDWQLGQLLDRIHRQDELNRLSSFAGGMAQIFPLKMEQASHAGDELAFWGKLIQSLGSGTGSFLDSGAGTAPAIGVGAGWGGAAGSTYGQMFGRPPNVGALGGGTAGGNIGFTG